MIRILNIETASSLCSISVAENGKTVAYKEVSEQNAHSSQLAVMVQEFLSMYRNEFNAIAVSIGPGSYTGLRIGLSMAKGLSYRLNISLLAVPTLKLIASGYLNANPDCKTDSVLCPMTDARRNEVYMARYDINLQELTRPQPLILDRDDAPDFFTGNPCIVMGNGSVKAEKIIRCTNVIFDHSPYQNANGMSGLSFKMYTNSEFADLAYQSPEYLKEFEAILPKKSVIYKGTHFDKSV